MLSPDKRLVHRWTGLALVSAIIIHVGGPWLTNPPDVIDALLFNSPAPFSAWGVIAMWVFFGAALLAIVGRRLRLRPKTWRFGHSLLALVGVVGSVVHAMLIEGRVGSLSKAVLCAFVIAATIKVLVDLRVWSRIVGGRF